MIRIVRQMKNYHFRYSILFYSYLGILLLIICAMVVFSPVGESRIITVDDNDEGDFNSIQDAINASDDGDTIRIFRGTYPENIIVNTSLSIVGNGSDVSKIIGQNIHDDVMTILADGCYISGIGIIGSSDGFSLQENFSSDGIVLRSNNTTISNVESAYHRIGILMNGTNGNIIQNTTSHSNRNDGIQLTRTNSTLLIHNSFQANNHNGIYLRDTNQQSVLTNNSCSFNEWSGIFVFQSPSSEISYNRCDENSQFGLFLFGSDESIITNNICEANRDGGIKIHNTDNTSIENNTLSGGNLRANGIVVERSNATDILFNNCSKNNKGIYISWSNAILIRSNTLKDSITGIGLFHSSFVIIRNNSCTNNSFIGIRIQWSDNNLISDNNCSNSGEGIEIDLSSFNVIEDNTIIENRAGIIITKGSYNNTIQYNSIYRNEEVGLQTFSGENLTAKFNYWGHDTGPFHNLNNGEGKGDNITDFILFEPWLNQDGSVHTSGKDDPDEGNGIPFPIYIAIGLVTLGSVSLIAIASRREDLRLILYSLMVIPLYSKLERDELLCNANRSTIFSEIRDHPGITYSEVLRSLHMANGTLVHHLRILELEGLIRSKKQSGRKRYFPASNIFSADLQLPHPNATVRGLPTSPIQATILGYVRAHGPSTLKDIELNCSLKQTSVSYNVRKLVERGEIIGSAARRNASYRIPDKPS